MKEIIKRIVSQLKPVSGTIESKDTNIYSYIKNGRIPWSPGYNDYKYKFISETINAPHQVNLFKNKSLPRDFAKGIDERAVEYPWIFSKLSAGNGMLLDAGSTFNFDFIVEHPEIKKKELTIYTFFPEKNCFYKNRINYVYGDLRQLYFRDTVFDEIVSQSTIEHIDMDNSIYGYEESNEKGKKSYEYLNAVAEMIRVLKPNGRLLLTFPFGKYENHGFFQQFDQEMLERLLDLFKEKGKTDMDYFKYEAEGWRFARKEEMSNVESYNPHSGKGKLNDGAAHCRGIACIEFIKNNS